MNKPVERQERLDIEAIIGPAGGRRKAGRAKWLVWLAVAAALAAGAWYLLAGRGGGDGVSYTTQPVTQGRLVVNVTATGSIQPTKMVDVSSELSGTVRDVFVDYNSPVTAGQKLAELDTDKLAALVGSSRARLAAAQARVADAQATVLEKERDLDRKKTLAEKQITSNQELELAEAAHARAIAALASAKADVGVAEADLRLNETNLAKAVIYSPIGGVVLVRNVDPGQTVASSFQTPVLFSIAEDLRQMELQVDVDEADVGQVRRGQAASFTVDAFPDRSFPATIRDIRFAAETIQGVVTYKALLEIDNKDLLLRPGMTATAEIQVIDITDTVLIPNAALRYSPPSTDGPKQSLLRRMLPGPPQFRPASTIGESGPNRKVWILRDGRPEAVSVVVGPSDGAHTQMLEGPLQAGQELITDQAGGE
ncbi:MAG: efflux RND transporter periplasmic adaptor subunit [Nitratireductor sp.]|nr:efflux RND transporter periplasmic adaptor subunit [Nitratireductor sp.]